MAVTQLTNYVWSNSLIKTSLYQFNCGNYLKNKPIKICRSWAVCCNQLPILSSTATRCYTFHGSLIYQTIQTRIYTAKNKEQWTAEEKFSISSLLHKTVQNFCSGITFIIRYWYCSHIQSTINKENITQRILTWGHMLHTP